VTAPKGTNELVIAIRGFRGVIEQMQDEALV
jgi:hypothetical protein